MKRPLIVALSLIAAGVVLFCLLPGCATTPEQRQAQIEEWNFNAADWDQVPDPMAFRDARSRLVAPIEPTALATKPDSPSAIEVWCIDSSGYEQHFIKVYDPAWKASLGGGM